ncbi:uncharacterized protein [Drosophila tropicalis]|uniref:uncharacterized protein n=1 Tax=Drosophila tropicalis TaxID=46794 RepID=UPI0035AC06CC
MLLLQLLLGLSALPTMVSTQTYYMNFIFNNNRYVSDRGSGEKDRVRSTTTKTLEIDSETLEVSSVEHSHSRDTSHEHKETPKASIIEWETDSINTDEIVENPDLSLWIWPIKPIKKPKQKYKKKIKCKATPSSKTTTTASVAEEDPVEITTEEPKSKGVTDVPHADDLFDFPLAKCHQDMDLHEVFGIRLEQDRGLPVKVYCNFSNSWKGPWLLMNRMELPARLHMRHWFFGYVSDDLKDMNINFLGLAHLINRMRIAMLILGQDNQNRLVYNLYDDVVISSLNDIFMLRKAHLVEANTTDLLFVSVGDVIESYSGRNRSCPFKVLGSWWGHDVWDPDANTFCVFPVDRDITRPGYMAIFIKPSPFPINNTALYEQEITTRRPWVTTANSNLMAQANNDSKLYRKLRQAEFILNKEEVQDEIDRRIQIYPQIEKNRVKEAQNQSDTSKTNQTKISNNK